VGFQRAPAPLSLKHTQRAELETGRVVTYYPEFERACADQEDRRSSSSKVHSERDAEERYTPPVWQPVPPPQSRSQELTIPAPPHQEAPPSLAANWRPLAIRLAAAVKAIYERDEDGVSAPGHLEALRLSEQLERMALDSDEGPR
jgi:hypothetical protein